MREPAGTQMLLLGSVNLALDGTATGCHDPDEESETASLQLLRDPVLMERMFCIAPGGAWCLVLPWLPSLAVSIAEGTHCSNMRICCKGEQITSTTGFNDVKILQK